MKLGDLDKAILALSSAIEGKKDFRQAYDLLEQCLVQKVSVI
jgi:hypothetical protein